MDTVLIVHTNFQLACELMALNYILVELIKSKSRQSFEHNSVKIFWKKPKKNYPSKYRGWIFSWYTPCARKKNFSLVKSK